LIKTVGPLPWKSEWAKKCVITYLPNQLALKMDDATREWNNNLDQSERVKKKNIYSFM